MSKFSINFYAKITPVETINKEFTHCKCYVLALGKNRNLSHISKEAADAAMRSLYNIPVIGHIVDDEDGESYMGAHDHVLVVEGGQYYLKSICVPYGVVPVQEQPTYEDVTEPDGTVRTYLTCDIILWTGRYPELLEAIYDDKTYFGQSMEISVEDSEPLAEDKNYTNILKYEYSALCLLGKSDDSEHHFEPCFPMARVDSYSYSIDDKFLKLMEELKSNLAVCFGKNTEKGGNGMDEMDVMTTTTGTGTSNLTSYDIYATTGSVETYAVEGEVSTETTTVEPESEDISENPVEETTETDNTEAEAEHTEMSEMTDAWTYEDRRHAIEAVLPQSELVHTWLCDFDDSYVFVEECDANWEHCRKGRYAYVEDKTNRTVTLVSEFEEMFVKWLTQDELASLEQLRSQYEALSAYKEERERTDREAAFDAVIGEFDDLTSNEDFINVVKDRYSYSDTTSLRKECLAIRGALHAPTAHKTTAEPVIPIGMGSTNTLSARDEFFAAHGIRRK